jgi:hypothetical protein
MPEIVIANNLPYTEPQIDPREALRDTLAFSADDWGQTRAMAWVYGIILGWDPDPEDMQDPEAGDPMVELADRFDWSPEQVERLRELHRRFDLIEDIGGPQ